MELPLDPKAELLKWGPTAFYPVLFYSQCITGFMNDFPNIFPGYSWPRILVLSNRKQFIWIGDAKEMDAHGQRLFLDCMLPKDIRESARQKWREARTQLESCEKEIDAANLRSLSRNQLQELWLKFNRSIELFWAHSCLPELSNYGSISLLESELKRHVPANEIARAMEILTAPEGLSFYQEEEIELAQAKDMAAHQKKHFWLRNSYANVEVLPIEFFIERQQRMDLNVRENNEKRLKEVRVAKDELQKKYGLSRRVLDIADAITDGIHWQDTRKKDIWIFLHYITVLLNEISSRTGVEAKALSMGTFTEISQSLEGEFDANLLKERLDAVGIFAERRTFEMLSKETAQKYWNTFVESVETQDVHEFKGIIASKSKAPVRGQVRIVLDPYQPGDFQPGNILVTSMTTPEFVFLMKKAGAVVTDQGGLTSHAAIVSRELGVPCLVGTRMATSVLKDGDLVEVDAAKGIVRKL